ncbi:DUF2188 domain-containing protein [Virgibacillus sp. W0430]|uniref:DUF2188 domain-containing protein n=1 Tax=Virgibacillus sp. W0430 TaxID=3391580 RepID=UPI003F459634
MPWTMNDYPDAMKKLSRVTKRKAIDIANAMIDEGYTDGQAIPIAIEQAKEWASNASNKEIESYDKNANVTKRSEQGEKYESNPERLREAEEVVAHKNGWAVQSSGAKRSSNVYRKKKDAIQRAKEIASNKGTKIKVYKKDDAIQEERSF